MSTVWREVGETPERHKHSIEYKKTEKETTSIQHGEIPRPHPDGRRQQAARAKLLCIQCGEKLEKHQNVTNTALNINT
jgi:hypothetical protein